MESIKRGFLGETDGTTADFYRKLNRILPKYLRIIGNVSAFSEDEYITRFTELYTTGLQELKPLKWLPGFMSIPAHVNLAEVGGLKTLSDIGIYPMDASSDVPAVLLSLDSPRKVLDLCCCPGGKLMATCDLLSADAVVVGVDVNEQRMNTCRALVKKHRDYLLKKASCEGGGGSASGSRCMLVLTDGTTFGTVNTGSQVYPHPELVFDSTVYAKEQSERGHRQRMNKSARNREKRLLRASQAPKADDTDGSRLCPFLSAGQFFDAVLVDAQCTHDGSYKHMEETIDPVEGDKGDVESLRVKKLRRVGLSGGEVESTCALQRRLLRNGFDRTRRGGILIYSTCSADRAQGEDVVRWLLDQAPNEAALEHILWDNVKTTVAYQTWGRAVDRWTEMYPDSSAVVTGELALDPVQVFEGVGEALAGLGLESEEAEVDLISLSRRISSLVARSTAAPLERSALLPESVRMSFHGGMSGLFVAAIRKV